MSSDALLRALNTRKKACDACKARKVKCNGETRCQQCSHGGLRCTYTATTGRARTYARGKILKELRGTAHEAQALHRSPRDVDAQLTATAGPAIDANFAQNFLPDYRRYVYPFHPIISPDEATRAVGEASSNVEAEAFLFALAGVTISLTRSESVYEQVTPWIEKAIVLQGPLTHTGQMTARRIVTTQWMHVCLMGMKRYDLAYFYLRHATAMVELLRIDDMQAPAIETAERARLQRLHYLVFIHERFLALAHQRSILLAPLKSLAVIDLTIPANIDHGFRQIARLFTHVDQDLLSKWNREGDAVVTPAWIEMKHQAIENESISAFDEDMGLSDFQLADLIITKHWLHMLLWQIAVSQLLLSSSSEEQYMTLLFPIRISAQLRTTLGVLPKEMFMIHGTAMHSKLFEITDTIGNVLVTVPALSAEVRAGRIADFLFLLTFLSSLPRWDQKQQDVLQEKLATLQSMYPSEL